MTDVHDWIEAARSACGLSPEEFVELPPEEARELIQRAKASYVEGNPRAWWLSLKPPTSVITDLAEDWLQKLPKIVDTQESFSWFVPESEDEELRVYRIAIEKVGAIIEDCPFFEYYVLGLDLSWLLIENDHNEVILAKSLGV